MKIDQRDRRIVEELQADGRLTNSELAERIGMSPSNCLRRVRALEEVGLIRGYTAIIDAKRAGYQLAVYILVHLDQRIETDAKSFLATVARDERVIECSAITGSHDFMIKAVVEDIEALGELSMETLLRLPSVKGLTSCLVIKTYKQARAFQLS